MPLPFSLAFAIIFDAADISLRMPFFAIDAAFMPLAFFRSILLVHYAMPTPLAPLLFSAAGAAGA